VAGGGGGGGKDWREGKCQRMSDKAYVAALEGLQVAGVEGLSASSVFADAEKGLSDTGGAARRRIVRLQKEIQVHILKKRKAHSLTVTLYYMVNVLGR